MINLKTVLFLIIIHVITIPSLTAQNILEHESKIVANENYNYQEISVKQQLDNFELNGTLITPSSDYEKVVIIIPGAGNDTRHSHHILTEILLEHNIAVYRYDERGVGLSQGENDLAYGINEKTNDLYYVIKTLKAYPLTKTKKIGLIGHSEGGLMCLGTIEKGLIPDFLLLLSTPAVNTTELFKYQLKTNVNPQKRNLQYDDIATKFTVMDSVQKIVYENASLDNTTLRKLLYKRLKKAGYKKRHFSWYITWSTYLDMFRKDYTNVLKNLNIPTLCIYGTDDQYVDCKQNIAKLEELKNPFIEIQKFEGDNHYLNTEKITTPTPTMYQLDKKAEDYILNWLSDK